MVGGKDINDNKAKLTLKCNGLLYISDLFIERILNETFNNINHLKFNTRSFTCGSMLVNGLPQHYSVVPTTLHLQNHHSNYLLHRLPGHLPNHHCLSASLGQREQLLELRHHPLIVPPAQVRVVLVNSRQSQLSN